MNWPEPIRALPLHDYVLKEISLREQPSFIFEFPERPSYELKLIGTRHLIGADVYWNCNIVSDVTVYRVGDFSPPFFAAEFQNLAQDNFFDRMEVEKEPPDHLLMRLEAAAGFKMVAIIEGYDLIESN